MLFLVFLTAGAGGFYFLQKYQFKKQSAVFHSRSFPVIFPTGTPTPTATPTFTPTPTNTPTLTPTPTLIPVGKPIRIGIPKLGINTKVVPVGLVENNAMDTPKNTDEVGWFTEKIKPGQAGTAILTAHYDTASGQPAIFYNIRALARGDKVIIFTDKDERLVFKVDKTMSLLQKVFPERLVYGSFSDKEMRLITCDGIWDSAEKSYSNRLIVFTKME